ncbi:hypothetical protein MHYP_G00269920 [Metynnis hypsauchen]
MQRAYMRCTECTERHTTISIDYLSNHHKINLQLQLDSSHAPQLVAGTRTDRSGAVRLDAALCVVGPDQLQDGSQQLEQQQQNSGPSPLSVPATLMNPPCDF